jgi:DeoR family transcriptional regulator, fructose operon transcriptional repressor
MYAEERQQAILAKARAEGRVDVAALADELIVTGDTIRRDLTVLARSGAVRRVRGGALPVERLGFEPDAAAGGAVMAEEKERIAKAALAELPDQGSVIIDAGSTTGRLVELVPAERRLTVIVGFLPFAAQLAARPNLTVLLVGGRIRGRRLAAVDDWALAALSQLCVDVAFIGCGGVSARRGLTTSDVAEAAVKRSMIAAARRTVLLADHTKVGNDRTARFGGLDDIDLFITDSGLGEEGATPFGAAGVHLIRV